MILIPGATGAAGSRVARLLSERGQGLRLLVRDPSRAPKLPGAEIAPARGRQFFSVAGLACGVGSLGIARGLLAGRL
jgi:nucleoside-diphosphate-sugar epimerase